MKEIDMQQELIEMLDKMVKYFDEISSDSYYYRETGAILNEAEKLVEKAKNSAKAPAVPQGNDPAWTLAAKVREALDRKACPGYYMDVAVEAVVHNYAPAAPSQPVNRPQNCGTSFCSCIECVCEPEPVTLTDSYAGVIAWIGDKQCKRVLTEAAIKHEHTPGVAMRNTAHQCVQEVIIAALREKEQTT